MIILKNGFYFVTICIKNRDDFFCKIENGKMFLNEFGEITKKCWLDLSNHYKNCLLDEFIIMPNHVHGIVTIENANVLMENGLVGNGLVGNGLVVGNGLKPFPTVTKIHGLSEIIRGFKTFSAKNINLLLGEKIFQWQKSFYDHIIRDEKSLNNIRQYIINNPANWYLDENNG